MQRGRVEFKLHVALLLQQGDGGKTDEQRQRERGKPLFHQGHPWKMVSSVISISALHHKPPFSVFIIEYCL